MLDFLDKDFKLAIINMFKEIMFKALKASKNFQKGNSMSFAKE